MSEEPTELPRVYIREWAKWHGYGQRQLAEKMGTTEATVSRLLSGKRKMTLEWLTAFSGALDRPVAEMFQDPDDPNPIVGARSIRETLGRIEGLTEEDIGLVHGVIMNAIKARRAAQEQTESHDQPVKSILLRE